MKKASGFPCPKCKQDDLAYIDSDDVVHILELRCAKCGNRWAVESAHPPFPGSFMDTKGRTPE